MNIRKTPFTGPIRGAGHETNFALDKLRVGSYKNDSVLHKFLCTRAAYRIFTGTEPVQHTG